MSSQFAKNKNVYGLLPVFLILSMTVVAVPAVASEKVCILTDAGQRVCGRIIQSNSESSERSSRSIFTLSFPRTDYSFKVQLINCMRKLRTVDCKFSIVKVGGESSADLDLEANAGSRVSQATDSQDQDYNAKQLTIGNEKTISYTAVRMNTGQPISAILSFEIPRTVNILKKLTLETEHIGNYSTVSFSNISISQ
jgi:hypothetical protein